MSAFDHAQANIRSFIVDLYEFGVPGPIDSNIGENLAWTRTLSDGRWTFTIRQRSIGRPCRVTMPGVSLEDARDGHVGINGIDYLWIDALLAASQILTEERR